MPTILKICFESIVETCIPTIMLSQTQSNFHYQRGGALFNTSSNIGLIVSMCSTLVSIIGVVDKCVVNGVVLGCGWIMSGTHSTRLGPFSNNARRNPIGECFIYLENKNIWVHIQTCCAQPFLLRLQQLTQLVQLNTTLVGHIPHSRNGTRHLSPYIHNFGAFAHMIWFVFIFIFLSSMSHMSIFLLT